MNGGVQKMSKKKRGIALVMILFLLVGIFFSYQYIIEKADHDCSRNDCPVCMQIEGAVHFISSIKFIPVMPYVVAILFAFIQKGFIKKENNCDRYTLITLKVELLN